MRHSGLGFLALALVALMAICANAPARAQAMKVVGFGDSVTYGVGFDVGGSSNCKPGDPDTCGYLPRLASSAYYNCSAAKCDFFNRGLSGERTTQGLTRIDQVLNERPWDLLILMQGTNDISANTSPQTVAFNLKQMANKAESRGVATAQSSIIWLNASFEREGMSNRNLLADNLSTLIASDALSRRRCFVDVRSKLCPRGASQANCVKKNYWTPPPSEMDFVGHPNANGYDILAKEFYRVLGSAGEPGAAEIVSPSGLACGKQAKLTWIKETVAATTCGNWFQVQIDGPSGNLLDHSYSEGDLCKGTDCTLISPVDFDDGTYSIRIRTRNTRGYGKWTKENSFTIIPKAPKVVNQLVAPIGEFFNAGGLPADFSWAPTAETDSYRVELVSKSSGVVFDGSFDAGEVCDGSTCSASLGDPLPTGEYTWRVLAANVCGGGWSEPEDLVVFGAAPQAAPATLAPVARIFDSTPTLRWEPVEGATEFEVQDAFGTSTTLPAADVCVGGVCRFTSGTLSPGPHTWRVRAVNPLGAGAWSPSIAFELAACDCFEGRAAGGSSFLFAVPETWTGDLVIWAHPSNYFGIREIEDFSPLAQRQFDEGAALATTSYSVTGWPLFKSERDLEKVYSAFAARYGEPTNVYLAGVGTGALVAVAAVETAELGNLVGALASCGPLADVANWEPVLDLRLGYDAICGEVRGAAIPGAAKGLPKPHDLRPSDIRNAVNVCTGVDSKRPERSTDQKQRLRELLEITALSESGLQDAMFQATFGLYDLVRDKRKLKGRLPVGNEGVDYGSAEVNSAIQRARADSKATAKLAKFYQPSGEIGDTKIISLHTSLDPIFFVENERNFADLAPTTGLTLGIVNENNASHCGFSQTELLASWRALKIWAEGARSPSRRTSRSAATASNPSSRAIAASTGVPNSTRSSPEFVHAREGPQAGGEVLVARNRPRRSATQDPRARTSRAARVAGGGRTRRWRPSHGRDSRIRSSLAR